MVKLDLDRKLLVAYTVRNCRNDEGRHRIGAELSAIVGGETDGPNQIFEMLLDTSVSLESLSK